MPFFIELLRFSGIGLVATFLHVLMAYVVNDYGKLSPLASNATGFLAAVTISYFGNFYWTFSARSTHNQSLVKFAFLSAASFASSSFIVYVTSALYLPYSLSLFFVLLLVPPINFVVARYWVFKPTDTRPTLKDFESLLILLTVSFLALIFSRLEHFTTDVSWYLYATDKWLNGATLYQDIMEINPPLAFYLHAPVILLSRLFHVSIEASFGFWVFALALGGILWARRLLGQSTLIVTRDRYIFLAAVFFIVCLMPINNFGQREHFMIIFTMPYIILSIFSPCLGKGERGAIGFLAVLGLALKPYFYTLPLLFALLTLLRKRSLTAVLTPEHMMIGLMSLAYALYVWAVHEDYYTLIMSIGMPVYEALGIPSQKVITRLVPAICALIFIIIAASKIKIEDKDRSIAISFITMVLAFILTYLLQFKGWDYHRIPLNAALILFALWVYSKHRWRPNSGTTKNKFLAGILIGLFIIMVIEVTKGPSWDRHDVSRFIPESKDKKTFMALSHDIAIQFPTANITGAQVTSRYPSLWLIPGAFKKLNTEASLSSEDTKELEDILRYARDTTVEDFINGKPGTVFIDTHIPVHNFGPQPFSYLKFFKEDMRFAQEWEKYRFITEVEDIEVWQRKPAEE